MNLDRDYLTTDELVAMVDEARQIAMALREENRELREEIARLVEPARSGRPAPRPAATGPAAARPAAGDHQGKPSK